MNTVDCKNGAFNYDETSFKNESKKLPSSALTPKKAEKNAFTYTPLETLQLREEEVTFNRRILIAV